MDSGSRLDLMALKRSAEEIKKTVFKSTSKLNETKIFENEDNTAPRQLRKRMAIKMNMLKRFKNVRSSSRSNVTQQKVIDVDVVDIHHEKDPKIDNDNEDLSPPAILSNRSSNNRDNNFNEVMTKDNSESESTKKFPLKNYPFGNNLMDVQAEISKESSNEIEEKDSKKYRRKRWSKNVNVLHLPRTMTSKNISSSVEASPRGSWTNNDNDKSSVSRNRQMMKENIEVNEGNSSYERIEQVSKLKGKKKDVLRIETDPACEETLIKLTSDCDSDDTTNSYTEFPDHQKEIDETIGTVEKFEEPIDELNFVRSSSEKSRNIFDKIEKLKLSDSLHSFEEIQNSSRSRDFSSDQSNIEDEGEKSSEKRKCNKSLLRQKSSSEDYSDSSKISSKQKRKTKKQKVKKKINSPTNDYENIEVWNISVMIHGTQLIESDLGVRHPMVKVHIVEINTGNYLKIPEALRKGNSSYLQPLVTKTFDFKENRSMIPQWNEELIFEYGFKDYLNSDKDRIILLFEIVDLVNFAEASYIYDQYGSDACWRRIAWAFMKPFGENGISRMNKKIRLQLFKPIKSSRRYTRHKCEVWTWWKSNIREKYSGTIVITVSSIKPQNSISNNSTSNELKIEDNHRPNNFNNITIKDVIIPKWSRLAAQSCKIPNELMFETAISENGCSYVAFSNDGKYLACANLEEYEYPIVVYEVDQGTIHLRFSGHNGFVYALDWSCNNDYLLSISSDHTARIWDVWNKIVEHVQVLPHPAYVYCGKFDPSNPSVVATGCQDHVTRIWIKPQPDNDYELSHELEGHEGFVNSACFQKNGDLLTADSIGIIIQWRKIYNRGNSLDINWQISRVIKNREFEGVIINTILLHPLGSRLLVHTRNNGLRILDLATGVILQRFDGLKNLRVQTSSCISPCGALVLCGGEDSILNIWDFETGRRLAKYEMRIGTISCVDYHPYDHVLAFSNYRGPGKTKILRYEKNSTGEQVNLKLIAKDDSHSTSSTNSFANIVEKSIQLREKVMKNPESSNDEKTTKENARKDLFKEEINYGEKRFNEKSKFRISKESDKKFKESSSNRLINIIEKIDIMLSTTYSAYKPERNHRTDQCYDNSEYVQQSPPQTSSNASSFHFETIDRPRRISIDNELNHSSNSSKSRISQTEHRKIKQARKIRSHSVQCTNNLRYDDTSLKTFSDGARNSESLRRHENIRQGIEGILNDSEHERDIQIESKMHRSNTFEIIADVNDLKDNDSNSDSGGTYIIEK